MTDHWKPWDRNRPRDYDVGKYRPPKHSQFKPGKSGNPNGRRKKPVHVGTIMDGLLNHKVTATVDGEKVKMAGIEALLRRCFAEALKGDHRMMKMFLDVAKHRTDATAQDVEESERAERSLGDKILDLLDRIEAETAEKEKEAKLQAPGAAPPA